MGTTIIIGAGVGGLAAAIRMAAAGDRVTVLERHTHLGGKMRSVPTAAGLADAGPTVMTMANVFEELFADAGGRLEDWVRISPEPLLARHVWSEGAVLDLFADAGASTQAVQATFGKTAAMQFDRFMARAHRLFDAFDRPMMQAHKPTQRALTRKVLGQPSLIAAMAPHQTLRRLLRGAFSEPKLAQLFGRYATYVGGSPLQSPALLALIAASEARGVWAVDGGMHGLAQAIAGFAETLGVRFQTSAHVDEIRARDGRATGVSVNGDVLKADTVLFNGDPRALVQGALGPAARHAIAAAGTEPRSLSAYVLSFAARPIGQALAHHTVFFGDDPEEEFASLAQGQTPQDPTLYVCAQDRGAVSRARPTLERFEIIMNGPHMAHAPKPEEATRCLTRIVTRLEKMGLTFDPPPKMADLTTPQAFATMFPESQGSLYGRSPHGLTAGLKRPTARTRLPGLYLVGGGAHPGAGVPMAALSARHAAETILADRISTLPSRRTGTHGGTSTGSATTAPAQSASSPS